MPYEISLERDPETGLDRYTIAAGPRFDAREAHELADWLSAAALNPTAAFTLDLSRVGGRPASILMVRSAWLRSRGRVEVVDARPAVVA
jgi:hypothetical protein